MIKAYLDTESLSLRMGEFFSKFNITPNGWTLISLVPAAAGFFVLAQPSYVSSFISPLIFAFFLFALSSMLDVIDGAVARYNGLATERGAFIDGIADRYVEVLLYMGLLVYLESLKSQGTALDFIVSPGVWICLLIFGAIMPTYARAYADHRKLITDPADLKRMGGFLERAERLILILSGMLVGAFNINFLVYIIAAACVLSNFTAIQRIYFALRYKGGGVDKS